MVSHHQVNDLQWHVKRLNRRDKDLAFIVIIVNHVIILVPSLKLLVL